MFEPRPKQLEVLRYQSGTMGVSAVPGSGKTWTLSALAANLILSGTQEEDQEILIVTMVNSAVNNFSSRISKFIQDQGLLPQIGYRVRTLHGLANDIIRMNPTKLGLDERYQIIDERDTTEIRSEIVKSWLKTNPYRFDQYLSAENDEKYQEWIRKNKLSDLLSSISLSFIRMAKDKQLAPARIRFMLDQTPFPLPLAEICCDIYTSYQASLAYRGGLDFDDLIRLSLQALETDDELLQHLQYQWNYILEDEAQDSSQLQENILRKLTGQSGNWVRVGDPNQAIYETFTTASPQHLIDFIGKAHFPRQLPNSGRSTVSIIDLANELIRWTQSEHPVQEVRNALIPPFIEPTGNHDPNPNPPDDPLAIHLVGERFSSQAELEYVALSLAKWLPEHPDKTAAVLVPINHHGFKLVDLLKTKYQIEAVDSLLRSSTTTRLAAGAVANILQFLSETDSPKKLARAFEVWRRGDREKEEDLAFIQVIVKILKNCARVEDFMAPTAEADWLQDLNLEFDEPDIYEALISFRGYLRRWCAAVSLPIDQLILTIAQDLFTDPAEIAIAHKLGLVLRQAVNGHPEWRLPEITQELAVIARNQRRFIGFGEGDQGFDADQYRGRVVVATMHKAKGLEWDRVYLMSVSNYDFPSGMEYDTYLPEKKYIREKLNLEAEAIAQLEALLSKDEYEWYAEGQATQDARYDFIRERLRLFYVGITRAREELIVTWNTGQYGKMQQSIPFVHLQSYWEEKCNESA